MFRSLNKQNEHNEKKIIQLIDKNATNSVTANLFKIKVEFSPVNCTSIMQPGIVENVKMEFSAVTSRKRSCRLKKLSFWIHKGGHQTTN